MKNRDLLKEAIADAKAVKETAIANAKIALEEAFTPFLKEKFASKLAEMEEEEMNERLGTINDPSEEGEGAGFSAEPHGNLEEEELDLNELLMSLSEEEETEEEETEEEMSLEDLSEDELRDLIEDIISQMVEDGELEAGDSFEGEDEDEDEDVDLNELLAEMCGCGEMNEMDEMDEMDEEIDLDELMFEIKRERMKSKMDEKRHPKMTGRVDMTERARPKMDKEKMEMKKKISELTQALEEISLNLQETKLLNSKLLYTNRIFRNNNLNESQKMKVLEAFDKAETIREAKMVFETFNNTKTKTNVKPITESVRGLASKTISNVASKKPILESDNTFARWQVLAGLKKN